MNFALTGESKAIWVNGQPVRPGPHFVAGSRPGLNTIVLQLGESDLPDGITLRATDVSFLTD